MRAPVIIDDFARLQCQLAARPRPDDVAARILGLLDAGAALRRMMSGAGLSGEFAVATMYEAEMRMWASEMLLAALRDPVDDEQAEIAAACEPFEAARVR